MIVSHASLRSESLSCSPRLVGAAYKGTQILYCAGLEQMLSFASLKCRFSAK